MTATVLDARAVACDLGLERVPFGAGCEDVHLATAALARREQLLERLLLGPGRLIVIVDAPGAGKSTVLRRVLAGLGDRIHPVQVLASATLGPEATLRRLAEALDTQPRQCSAAGLAAMRRQMAQRAAAGRPTVVAVDDAQRLTAGAVELLVRLAARWAEDGLRVVLCGRPELVPTIVELADGCPVPVRFVDVPPLDTAETGDLIHLHLHTVGLRGDSPFDAGEVRRIARAAGGRPGRVGQLATEVLAAHARSGGPTRLRRRWVVLAGAGAALAGLGLERYRRRLDPRDDPRRSPAVAREAPFRSRVVR